MYVILVHQKCAKALAGEFALSKNMSITEKVEVMEFAYSLFILHLSDSVLRKVDNTNTATKL